MEVSRYIRTNHYVKDRWLLRWYRALLDGSAAKRLQHIDNMKAKNLAKRKVDRNDARVEDLVDAMQERFLPTRHGRREVRLDQLVSASFVCRSIPTFHRITTEARSMQIILRADDASFCMLSHRRICQLSEFLTKHDDFVLCLKTRTPTGATGPSLWPLLKW